MYKTGGMGKEAYSFLMKSGEQRREVRYSFDLKEAG